MGAYMDQLRGLEIIEPLACTAADGSPIICHCLLISEKQLRSLAAAGCARSIADFGRNTGAGTGCTCCHQTLRRILAEEAPELTYNPAPICSVK